jgi:hypothetical protein
MSRRNTSEELGIKNSKKYLDSLNNGKRNIRPLRKFQIQKFQNLMTLETLQVMILSTLIETRVPVDLATQWDSFKQLMQDLG